MIVLGIGGYSHDAAAALVVDGQLVAAVAEERISRVKHQGGAPRRAVEFCLTEAGVRPQEVDALIAYMRPGIRLLRRIPYRFTQMPRSPIYSTAFVAYELFHNSKFIADMRSLRGPNAKLYFADHHPAHAASAFLVSPFDSAALLTLDYIGEWTATWMGVGEGTAIRELQSISYPNSLGVFYSAITDYLGFARASDEYKVMGLASYGEPEFYEDFKKILRPDAEGGYNIDRAWTAWHYLPGSRRGYFSKRFIDRFGPPRKRNEPITPRHANIAASAQRILEEVVLGLACRLQRATGQKRLCLAGGVALNCAMNGRLLREGPFDEIYVQPAAGDDGTAIGAALQVHHAQTAAPRAFQMHHALYGPSFSDAAIKSALDRAHYNYETPESIEARAAELLAQGRIVGWFQGKMEFGPRALGARSILADPTRPEMKDVLNAKVKFREEFRPFAPSVIEERAGEYFEGCTRSPFMLFVHPVRPECRELLPAITHIDGTARVQTVDRASNPRYYRLLQEFEKLRGVPVLVNTSFNIMGEPIVNTPEEALNCFRGTGMDALAIGGMMVVKER